LPSVLVTGASRGIGRAITTRLASKGWQVYAGVRSIEDAERLRAERPAVTPVLVDVTDDAAVKALPDQLDGRLDALVNNAGVVVSGPIEGLALDELRRQFEVNVVGQVAVTQAVLPLLRQSAGRIVFTSSVSGRVSAPLLGAYSGSKYALEAVVDALRVEVRPWKIRVSLVEPGSIDTDIWRKAQETADEVETSLKPEHRDLYRQHIAGTRKLVSRIQKQTSPPGKVADAVERALTASRPRARYVVGADARAQLALKAATPTPMLDAVLARVGGIR
jgi:NAD(P)-dependent dehydrogenase (short-subunit alcohol dehydrogenase family)